MQDIVLSAFSVFYLQCPSFLSYQQDMEHEQGNNNARTLFGIEVIPTHNHTRTLLDAEEPKKLFPVFNEVFHGLEQSGSLDGFRGCMKQLYVSPMNFRQSSKSTCKNLQ
jgi:hypothetical protein